MTWIRTFTGRRWEIAKPTPEAVDIADVAHALSLQCRFAGHTRQHYSVAEHSVRVSWLAEQLAGDAVSEDEAPAYTEEQVREIAFAGLMHDAAEAYPPGDILAPLKRMLEDERHADSGGVLEYQEQVEAAVSKRFGLMPYEPELVKVADQVLLATEWRDLMGAPPVDWHPDPLGDTIQPWNADRAELRFLLRFKQLAPHESLRSAVERLVPQDAMEIVPMRVPAHERREVLLMRLVLIETHTKDREEP